MVEGVEVTLLEAFVTRGPGGRDARGDGAPEPRGSAEYVLGGFRVENVSRRPAEFEGILAFRLYAGGADTSSGRTEQRPTPLRAQIRPESLPARYEIFPSETTTLAPGEVHRGAIGWAVVAGPEAGISLSYEPD